MQEPMTNINVTMTIPSQKYMAASMEIMAEYGDVVKEALDEVKTKLITDEAFKKEVKSAIKVQIHEAVEKAIKHAAERCVWELYRDVDADIDKLVQDAILSGRKKKDDEK